MTYARHLGEWYNGLGALDPRKQFSSFLFLYFNKKYVEVAISDSQCIFFILEQLRRQCKTEEKNNEIIRGKSERTHCLGKCFHSFKHVIDHTNLHFFF